MSEETTAPNTEGIRWKVDFTVAKYEGDWSAAQIENGDADKALIELLERKGNLLTIGGSSALWERLISTSITAFDNTNAYLGVGDSTSSAADTQTDLQASSNKVRKAMDATYPTHTDSTSSSGAKSIVYKSTYGTSDANFAWQEWGIFNASSGGRMLNRKVESLGTKSSSATWVLTVTLSLA